MPQRNQIRPENATTTRHAPSICGLSRASRFSRLVLIVLDVRNSLSELCSTSACPPNERKRFLASSSKCKNNRAEKSHLQVRRRERKMQRFKSPAQANLFT
jgi:transposase-like protein